LPAEGFRDIELASSTVFRGRAFYCNYGVEARAEVAVLAQPSGRITVSTTSVEANTTFTASMPPGATSYVWNVTNGSIESGANSNAATIRAGSSGVVTVNGTASNGEGGSGSDTALVSIIEPIPPPLVTGWPDSAPPRQFGEGFPIRFSVENGTSWSIRSSFGECLYPLSGSGDGPVQTVYHVCLGVEAGVDTVTLTVTGPGGTTVKTLDVLVNCGHPATLEAATTSIPRGSTTTLRITPYSTWTLTSSKGNPLSKTSGCCLETVTFTGAVVGTDTVTLTWQACPGEPNAATVQITVN
jgi:PKD repeat protein